MLVVGKSDEGMRWKLDGNELEVAVVFKHGSTGYKVMFSKITERAEVEVV